MGSGKCVECSKALSHDETFYWVNEPGGEATCSDCKINRIERNRDKLAEQVDRLQALLDAEKGNYWSYQGDGEDHLESLTCPVVIQPRVLEKILGERASGFLKLAHEKALTAKLREALSRIGTMPNLHEGNSANIILKRKDYEFIQKTRQLT